MTKPDRLTRSLERSTSVHVSLPAPLAARLDEAARRLGVTRSLLTREAIDRGLKPAVDALRQKLRRMRDADTDAGSGANSDADSDSGK